VKVCTKCGEEKSPDGFARDKRRKDGLQVHCKACYREWYVANAERKQAAVADNYRANRAKYLTYNNAYYQENAERLREYRREYCKANHDAVSAAHARRRAQLANAHHEPYTRSEILARWGGKCCYCNALAEHLDHVTPISRNGADAEWNLVPACAPCNHSKYNKSLAEWAATF
jgi:5-methylcytosine-specific restriction endonuclease McrA